jgi:uncharacterized protein YydD (DUF2326 family)
MKIRRIYCNDNTRFHNIKFTDGLNVIQADIKDRLDNKKDTHNLGKTLLIQLIDFLMLKQIERKQRFFLTKGGFEGQEFFAELQLNSGHYLIIRRTVDTPSKISFKRSETPLMGFNTNIHWDEEDLPLDKAQKYLNDQLCFDIVPKWPYRKSVTYFLRTQNDFRDIFRLDKFSRGADKDWKPFMFDLLGFDGDLIAKKYELESELDELDRSLETLEIEANVKAGEKDKIQGLIQIKLDEKQNVERQIDRFNFYEKDKNINEDLVDSIDSQIRTLNTRRYNCSYEVSKIEESLAMATPSVDIYKLKTLFEEVELHFPKDIEKSFQSLLDFNATITSERNKILQENLVNLKTELNELDANIAHQEKMKQDALSFLTQRDSYAKFKEYQKQLAQLEGNIANLEDKLTMVTRTSELEERRPGLKAKIDDQRQLIKKAISQQCHSEIRMVFNKIIGNVLNTNGLISVTINKEGNVEFTGDIQNPKSLKVTDESGGTTYKKLMCMAFDISILIVYSKASFYRFVYHDGALETVEDRKKMLFIQTVRQMCSEYGLQYIMTLIDSDLPMDETEKVIPFHDEEICLRLHDRDDSGKLFKKSF